MILVVKWPLGFMRTAGLAGPIFDKELRVASRRRRHYALRFAYVIMLMLFVATIWIDAVRFRGSTAMQQTQMEAAAKILTRGIIWFQFIAAQIVAVITMSTAISDEVYGRTLAVLMTTPLSSFQIVMGKLFSRLFQILLLVATTLPLLAIVRVLGGIPWSFLLWSLLITWTAVVFAGSVSLFFSALCRRAYAVIIASALSIGFVFAFLPFLANVVLGKRGFDDGFVLLFRYVNPYVLLLYCTEYMLSPRLGGMVPVASLISCNVFLLLGSASLLHASVRLVRQVALRRTTGEMTFLDYLRRGRPTTHAAAARRKKRDRGIRRVVGPPMIWKELTCALSRRQRTAAKLAVGTEVLLVLIAYTFPAMAQAVSYDGAHVLYLWFFLGLGVLFTLSVSATVISSERESRAWPVLLMTPLRDRDILIGKFVGVLRRCGLIWLPLLAYMVAFTLAGCFHPLAIVQIVAMMVSIIIFMSATGFYFGSRCRRTAEAVTANLILVGILWCIGPLIVEWIARAADLRWYDGQAFVGVPFVQVIATLTTTLVGMDGFLRWPGHRLDAWDVTLFILFSTAVYALIASLFVWRAMRAFRRRII